MKARMDDLISFKHADLCDLAVKWLKRPNSQNGHGCHVAVSEVKTGWSGEIPDAIGFRAAGWQDGSVVVEVKVSRADFLADKKKPHRQDGKGVGNYRYFMCPEGMIQPDELPPKWGLLWVNSRGHVKAVAGPAASAKRGAYEEALEAYRHDSDMQRERWMLVKLLNRVGDVEELNKKLKLAYAESSRLIPELNKLRKDVRMLEMENRKLRYQLHDNDNKPEAKEAV